MSHQTTSPLNYALGILTVATVVAAAARALQSAAPESRASELGVSPSPVELATRRTLFAPVRGPLRYDLMGHALVLTGLAIVFAAIVHGMGFLLPIGLAWCMTAVAVTQLKSGFASAGALSFAVAGLTAGADAIAFGLTHITRAEDSVPAAFALLGLSATVLLAAIDLAGRTRARLPLSWR